MTPESPQAPAPETNNNPEATPTVEGTFVVPEQVPHSGEGVIDEFETPLAEVSSDLEVPKTPADINPETLDVPYTPIETPALTQPEVTTPAVETEKKSKFKIWAAGLIGTVVLAGSGGIAAKAMSGDSENVAPTNPEASTSAEVTPGTNTTVENTPAPEQSETSAEVTPGVGVEGTTPETVNTSDKAKEFVNDVLHPVVVDTPEQALEQFEIMANIRELSGTTDGNFETEESIATRDKLDSFLFEGGVAHFDSNTTANEIRTTLSVSYNYIGGPNVDVPEGEAATYRKEWTVTDIKDLGNDVYSATIDVKRQTNLATYDPIIEKNITDINTPMMFGTVTFVHRDGKWSIRQLAMQDL